MDLQAHGEQNHRASETLEVSVNQWIGARSCKTLGKGNTRSPPTWPVEGGLQENAGTGVGVGELLQGDTSERARPGSASLQTIDLKRAQRPQAALGLKIASV